MKLYFVIASIILSVCHIADNASPTVFPDGGYDFIKAQSKSDTEFYCLPVRSLLSKRDSALESVYEHRFMQAFDEPNISLRPADTAIFRFSYEQWTSPAYIITLLPDKLIVKTGDRVDYMFWDETKLTNAEKRDLEILGVNYPIIKNNRLNAPRRQTMLDSLIAKNPRLLDDAYYPSLLNKVLSKSKTFSYSTKILTLSRNDYQQLVDLIYGANYWKLPVEIPCNNTPSDAGGFILEANNGKKYNFVKATACGDPPGKFTEACHAIVQAARIKDPGF